ncbi:uncharacterized protein LOC126853866 [Cataglyphis hispanica]|uniref:uncharacterized protein LOC126853866 n=1 Tax=Cataglyphis hispanica TaxID=1086592 RepID=UPI00217F42E2|nr:uncharacterized protein LOC126853866 [Cataglyphis hispanica]
MAKTKEIICSLDMKKNNNNSISADLSNQEEKDKLLDEIVLLEAHVSLLETMIVTPKFGQLKFEKLPLTHDSEAVRFHIPDVQTELCHELYRFVGLRCRDIDQNSRFVFEINSTEQNNEQYAIEILIDENGCGKLGKWVLPMFINVQEILSQYPIDNLNNVKYFLKSCKHHVDSYLCRLKQFKELQNSLSGIKNIHVSHTLGIILIEFVISGIKDIDTDEFYNVILYLYYESTAARPYKLSSDVDDNEKPSPILVKKLNKYFKPFLKENLSLAFLQISESQTKFVWQKIMANDNEDIAEVFDKSDNENMGFLTEFLHRGDKKRQKKSKNKVQNEEITLRGNEMETSLSVEKEKFKDTNVTDNAAEDDSSGIDKRIKSRKRKRLTKTIVKPSGAKKSQADLKKFKKGISNTEKNSDRNIADIDYPSDVTSGLKSIVQQKKSNNKIREANIEHVQMEDNYNRKKDSIDKNKKSYKELLNKSNSEHSINSQKEKRKTITRINQIEKKRNISKLKNNKQAKLSSSTPISKRLTDKSYAFDEMSSIGRMS